MDKDIHDRLDRARTIATENMKKASSGLKESADRVKEQAARVGEQAKAASATAGETLDKAKERAGRVAGHANRIVTEHPLAAAAAAVAVGAVVAHLFPRSTKKVREKAPGLLATAGSLGLKARDLLAEQAKKAAPVVEEGEQLLGKIGDAARKAPSSAADAARAGLETARSGLDTARSAASETLRKAEIEDHASKWLDAASVAASKLATKLRNRAKDISNDS